MGAPEFWNDPDKARSISSKAAGLKKKLESFLKLESRAADIGEGIQLAKEFDDADLAHEAIRNAATLEADLRSFELLTLLNQPADISPCYLVIQSGAGGTEACDWAQMLHRMYTRWAESKGYTVETLDWQDGDEAGLRSATLKITGDYAYGFLKNERGVHRLVRISCLMPPPSVTLPLRQSTPHRRSPRRSTSRSPRRMSRSPPRGPAARAARMSTRSRPRCCCATFQRAS